MSRLDSLLRTIWRLIPGRDRLRTTKPYIALRGLYYRLRWRGVGHDQIFDRDYFQFVERTTSASAVAIADSICRDFQPKSVIDIGCGTGVLLERLRERGVDVRGYERATAALEYCRTRGLEVTSFDIINDAPRPADQSGVAVCMEVAHQLPPAAANKLVDLLCFAAPVVVFSSETPGGGDRCAFNEQPREYWIAKFRERGFAFDEERTPAWQADWRSANVSSWFSKNLMLFRRAA